MDRIASANNGQQLLVLLQNWGRFGMGSDCSNPSLVRLPTLDYFMQQVTRVNGILDRRQLRAIVDDLC
jgi:hypothetical protein